VQYDILIWAIFTSTLYFIPSALSRWYIYYMVVTYMRQLYILVLAGNDMDVNEPARLSNITLWYKAQFMQNITNSLRAIWHSDLGNIHQYPILFKSSFSFLSKILLTIDNTQHYLYFGYRTVWFLKITVYNGRISVCCFQKLKLFLLVGNSRVFKINIWSQW
jgi:hypothetical protein